MEKNLSVVGKAKNVLKKITKKQYVILAVLFMCSEQFFAQNGATGINSANAQLRSYVPLIANLILAIGGIVGIIGGIRVFIKWNSGDPDVNKSIMSWFGSCIFLVLVSVIVRAFFGV